MRRISVLLLAVGLMSAIAPAAAHAQRRGDGGGSQGDDQRKARLDREMQTLALPLPPVVADGPCPYVKVLYDAARYVEFKDARVASSNVAYSGEIEGLISDCQYKGDAPITVSANITFRFGRGPQGAEPQKLYRYWVAVTDRNRAVLAKEYFQALAVFSGNSDRAILIDQVQNITIPRKAKSVSGENFEVLIGFEVTPQQAEFNRSGARFRVNAAGDQATSATTPAPAAPAAPAK